MSYHGFADKADFDRALDAHITREPTEYPCDECGEIECSEDCRRESCTEALAAHMKAELEAKNDRD